jgi:hypothetical protein
MLFGHRPGDSPPPARPTLAAHHPSWSSTRRLEQRSEHVAAERRELEARRGLLLFWSLAIGSQWVWL